MASPSSNNYNSQSTIPLINQPVPQFVAVLPDMPKKQSTFRILYSILHIIIAIFAIFLSFHCNTGPGKSFDILSFLAALFFPHFYILYIFVTKKNFCDIQNFGKVSS
jgi:hypothetical protein